MKRLFLVLLALIFTFPLLFAAETVLKTDIDNKNINAAESDFGNLVADALKNKANADIAVLPAQSFNLKGTLAAGKFTEDDLKGLLVTPNSAVVILNLSSKEMFEMFERSVSFIPQGNAAFLQVSGAELVFDSSSPMNSRVVKITINGEEISKTDGQKFTVAMPLELGRGGSGYTRIFSESIAGLKMTEYTIIQALREHIKELPALELKLENRIMNNILL